MKTLQNKNTAEGATEWVTISPALAIEFLKRNKSNRTLSKDAVYDIARRMKAGISRRRKA